MALLQNVFVEVKSDSLLPNPNGHLSKVILSFSIIAANEAVKHAVSQTTKTRRSTASAFGNCQSRVLIHATIKEVPKYLN